MLLLHLTSVINLQPRPPTLVRLSRSLCWAQFPDFVRLSCSLCGAQFPDLILCRPISSLIGGRLNSVSLHLTSSSCSEASLSQRSGGGWSPPPNFFANIFLTLLNALIKPPFFFAFGVTWGALGGGSWDGDGDGGREYERACGCTTSHLDSSTGPAIGDTIVDVCWSQQEESDGSEGSSTGSGLMT